MNPLIRIHGVQFLKNANAIISVFAGNAIAKREGCRLPPRIAALPIGNEPAQHPIGVPKKPTRRVLRANDLPENKMQKFATHGLRQFVPVKNALNIQKKSVGNSVARRGADGLFHRQHVGKRADGLFEPEHGRRKTLGLVVRFHQCQKSGNLGRIGTREGGVPAATHPDRWANQVRGRAGADWFRTKVRVGGFRRESGGHGENGQ